MGHSDRENLILDILKTQREVSVSFLMEKLYVSEATVRRELKRLEENGQIIRAYGKAMLPTSFADKRIGFIERESFADKTKDKLAEEAVKHIVKDGQVVFLDASSTAMHAVKHLERFNDIIVITSGIKTLFKLTQTNLKYYSTGGLAINKSSSLVGQTAIDTVNSFNADVCLVSCHTLSDDGYATDTSVTENDLRMAILKRSKRKVLLIDSSKIGNGCWNNLCHISEFDDVFCDTTLPEEILKTVKNFHKINI